MTYDANRSAFVLSLPEPLTSDTIGADWDGNPTCVVRCPRRAYAILREHVSKHNGRIVESVTMSDTGDRVVYHWVALPRHYADNVACPCCGEPAAPAGASYRWETFGRTMLDHDPGRLCSACDRALTAWRECPGDSETVPAWALPGGERGPSGDRSTGRDT